MNNALIQPPPFFDAKHRRLIRFQKRACKNLVRVFAKEVVG